MYNFEKYAKDGLLSSKFPPENGENNVLFACEYFVILSHSKGKTQHREAYKSAKVIFNLYSGIDDKWHPLPDHSKYKEEGFSRDNMIGLTSFGKYFSLPTFKNAGIDSFCVKYLQPQDVIYFLWCKYGWLVYPLLPILYLNILHTCYKNKKTPSGNLHTDGKRLSLIRLLTLIKRKAPFAKLLFKLCTKVLLWRVRKYDPTCVYPWTYLQWRYFRKDDYPIYLTTFLMEAGNENKKSTF